MITTADLGHSARLIDVASHQLVGPMLPINDLTGPVFSGDSKTLGTSTRSSGALLSVDPTVWREQACALVGRNLTEDEWARYLPDNGPRQATCPAVPVASSTSQPVAQSRPNQRRMRLVPNATLSSASSARRALEVAVRRLAAEEGDVDLGDLVVAELEVADAARRRSRGRRRSPRTGR